MKDNNSGLRPIIIGIGMLLASLEILVWLIDEWSGYFISILLSILSFSILVLSYVFEFLERSRIPKWYFPMIWIILLVSISIFAFMTKLNENQFDWNRK
ncbi:MAG: hypothetical protein ABI851_03760 [Saprospiraceae bacterium]